MTDIVVNLCTLQNNKETSTFRFVDGVHDFGPKNKLGILTNQVLKAEHGIFGDVVTRYRINEDNSTTPTSPFKLESGPQALHPMIKDNLSGERFQVKDANDNVILNSTSPTILNPVRLENLLELRPFIPPEGNYIVKIIGEKARFKSTEGINTLNTFFDGKLTQFKSYYSKDAIGISDDYLESLLGSKGKYLLAGLIDPAPGQQEQLREPFEYKILYSKTQNNNQTIPIFNKISRGSEQQEEGNTNIFHFNFSTNCEYFREVNRFSIDPGSTHSSPSIENICKWINSNVLNNSKKTCWNVLSSYFSKKKSKMKQFFGFKLTKSQYTNLRNIDWNELFMILLDKFKNALQQPTLEVNQIINCLISYKTNGDQSYFQDAIGFKNYPSNTSAKSMVISGDKFLCDYVDFTKELYTFNKAEAGKNIIIEVYVPIVNSEEEQARRQQLKAQLTQQNIDLDKVADENLNLKKIFNLAKVLINKLVTNLTEIQVTQGERRNQWSYVFNGSNLDEQTNPMIFYFCIFTMILEYIFYQKQQEQFEIINKRYSPNEVDKVSVGKLRLINQTIESYGTIIQNYQEIIESSGKILSILQNNLTKVLLTSVLNVNTQYERLDFNILNIVMTESIENQNVFKKLGLNKYFISGKSAFGLKKEIILILLEQLRTKYDMFSTLGEMQIEDGQSDSISLPSDAPTIQPEATTMETDQPIPEIVSDEQPSTTDTSIQSEDNTPTDQPNSDIVTDEQPSTTDTSIQSEDNIPTDENQDQIPKDKRKREEEENKNEDDEQRMDEGEDDDENSNIKKQKLVGGAHTQEEIDNMLLQNYDPIKLAQNGYIEDYQFVALKFASEVAKINEEGITLQDLRNKIENDFNKSVENILDILDFEGKIEEQSETEYIKDLYDCLQNNCLSKIVEINQEINVQYKVSILEILDEYDMIGQSFKVVNNDKEIIKINEYSNNDIINLYKNFGFTNINLINKELPNSELLDSQGQTDNEYSQSSMPYSSDEETQISFPASSIQSNNDNLMSDSESVSRLTDPDSINIPLRKGQVSNKSQPSLFSQVMEADSNDNNNYDKPRVKASELRGNYGLAGGNKSKRRKPKSQTQLSKKRKNTIKRYLDKHKLKKNKKKSSKRKNNLVC